MFILLPLSACFGSVFIACIVFVDFGTDHVPMKDAAVVPPRGDDRLPVLQKPDVGHMAGMPVRHTKRTAFGLRCRVPKQFHFAKVVGRGQQLLVRGTVH